MARWGNTMWADLDITLLTNGIDEFSNKLRRLPKNLKETMPFKQVEAKVNSFKEAIPLFQHLKNPALKSRHWKALADITGKSFVVCAKKV